MTATRPARVAMVSRTDGASSGAGNVADLLTAGLRSRGNDVRRFVKHAPAARSDGADIGYTVLHRLLGDAYVRTVTGWDASGAQLLRAVRRTGFDVVHLHDVSVAFGVRAARRITLHAPVVVTLHDCSPFTGGCLMAAPCTRYAAECGRCPQLGSWPLVLPVDTTRATHRAARGLAAAPGVLAVSPSRLFAERARAGAWRTGKVVVIDNPVDERVFVPAGRPEGRERLGAANDARLLLFVAADLNVPRKGLAYLAAAVPELFARDPRWRLVLVGRLGVMPTALAPLADRITVVSHVTNRRTLAAIYAAADVLALTSTQENVPCAIAEALSAGTPVVAHRIDAVPEMFEEGVHGRLVTLGDARELVEAVLACDAAAHPERRAAISRYATARYALRAVAARYEEAYAATRGEWLAMRAVPRAALPTAAPA